MTIEQWVGFLKDFGALAIILWWMTQKLIPKMMEGFDKSLIAFQQEMALERQLHREVNDKLSARNERAITDLVEHLSSKH